MAAIVIQIGRTCSKYPFSGSSPGLSIGRAFHNDVIIPDPYISPVQLSIAPVPGSESSWQIKILDSANPVLCNRTIVDSDEFILESGQEIHIGRTSMTIFSEHHPVLAARTFAFNNWLHTHKFQPLIAFCMLLALFGLVLLLGYLETDSKVEWGKLAAESIATPVVTMLWACLWALTGRFLRNHHYFYSHVFFATSFAICLVATENLNSYADYIFSSPLIGEFVDLLLVIVITGCAIGINLSLASNASRPLLKSVCGSASIFCLVTLLSYFSADNFSRYPSHSTSFKPGYIPVSSIKSAQQHIAQYDDLILKVSSQAAEK